MRAAVDGAPSCALKTRDERNTCRDKFGKIDDRVIFCAESDVRVEIV